jgi:hypothetical protein
MGVLHGSVPPESGAEGAKASFFYTLLGFEVLGFDDVSPSAPSGIGKKKAWKRKPAGQFALPVFCSLSRTPNAREKGKVQYPIPNA